MPARTLSLILGLWQFFSAFALPRTPASFANAWIVGLLAAVFALAGMSAGRARFVDTALSAWLLASAFVLPHRTALAVRNDAAVAIAILLLSLVPGTMYTTGRRRVSA